MQTHLMTTPAGKPEPDADAEPVIVDTDNPDVVVLHLDDGKHIALDASELRAALEVHRQAA